LGDAVNRVLGRSVVDLAGAVDEALADLARARGVQAECEVALELAKGDVRASLSRLADARAALFKEHPDLLADAPPLPTGATPANDGSDGGLWETVEVDDPDAPPAPGGGTSRGRVPPAGDLADMWAEHDE
jgi:hypothetical protein